MDSKITATVEFCSCLFSPVSWEKKLSKKSTNCPKCNVKNLSYTTEEIPSCSSQCLIDSRSHRPQVDSKSHPFSTFFFFFSPRLAESSSQQMPFLLQWKGPGEKRLLQAHTVCALNQHGNKLVKVKLSKIRD